MRAIDEEMMNQLSTETAHILDDITFDPDVAALARRVRVKETSSHFAELVQLLDSAVPLAKPKALYKLAYIDNRTEDSVVVDGVTLTSRVLRVNLDTAHRVFAYLATCGAELQGWSDELDDMLLSYWADAIKEQALATAIQALAAHLSACYKLGRTATMAPGSLADWPIREQRPLFRILGDPEAAIGVVLTESFLMIPNKTVSGVRFPTESRFESCQLCPRDGCPGRRAAYDPDLYASRYSKT
jgi:hypothetical protein